MPENLEVNITVNARIEDALRKVKSLQGSFNSLGDGVNLIAAWSGSRRLKNLGGALMVLHQS